MSKCGPTQLSSFFHEQNFSAVRGWRKSYDRTLTEDTVFWKQQIDCVAKRMHLLIPFPLSGVPITVLLMIKGLILLVIFSLSHYGQKGQFHPKGFLNFIK